MASHAGQDQRRADGVVGLGRLAQQQPGGEGRIQRPQLEHQPRLAGAQLAQHEGIGLVGQHAQQHRGGHDQAQRLHREPEVAFGAEL